jgi:chromodomain-helicase-DNA-binding protein 4
MDDEEGGGDVRSILTYGALALFDETATSRDITCALKMVCLQVPDSCSSDSEQDLNKLIEKTETEKTAPEETGEDPGQAFSFAQVWTTENDALEELEDQALGHTEATDSWALALALIAKEHTQTKAAERFGRGVRRKTAIAAENQVQQVVLPAPNDSLTSTRQKIDYLDSPIKDKSRGRKRKKSGPTVSEESDTYVNANLSQSENSSDESLGYDVTQDIAELGVPAVEGSELPTRLPPPTANPVSRPAPTYAWHTRPASSPEPAVCSMCGNLHQGTCGMTELSENLVHYRQLLFTEQTGESFEERVCPLRTLWLCGL